tara:strand:- start:457 stop:1236 length:780 start_codon:yes stop_codon:yes gene_type:complete
MKLTIKQKFELMYDRYMNYFHHQEKRNLTYYSHFFGDKLLQIEEDGLQVSVENFDKRYVNSFWQYSSFGSMFELYEEISEYINGDVDRYRLLLKKVSPHCYSFKRVYKGSLKDTELEAPDICGLTKLFKVGSLHRTTINAIRGHINQPLFEKGSIVNLRSNCGVDAVVKPRKMSYGNTYRYEGVGTSILQRLKDKTFMVLGEKELEPESYFYSAVYSHTKKQGGARLYTVLPIGEAQTYFMVEKFMKKCRTKAVKDAKK